MSSTFWPGPYMLGRLAAVETPPEFEDRFFQYILPSGGVPFMDLAAGEIRANEVLPFDADSDFIWRGLTHYAFDGPVARSAIRFQDSDGYWRQSARVVLASISNVDPGAPAPIFPEIVVPARGQIIFEIENTSAADAITGMALVLWGVKRSRAAR